MADSPLNVLFATAECFPLVKVGGLADVAGSLPAAMRALGHDVRIALPHHGPIDDAAHDVHPLMRFDMPWGRRLITVQVSEAEVGGVPVYLLRGGSFFVPEDDFVYGPDADADVGRFLFFSAAALELARCLSNESDWRPDMIHANDWHAAALPYLLAHLSHDDPLDGTASLLSIHNMAYQGVGLMRHLKKAGLPQVKHPLLRADDLADNSLAVGLAYADVLNAVSPRYAQEIQEPDNGHGLEDLLRARSSCLVGILNGIDTDFWNPANPDVVAAPYDVHNLQHKVANKTALQEQLGLPKRPDAPLLASVTRLVHQKGIEPLLAASRGLLAEHDVQFVLLGTGIPEFEAEAGQLAEDFPERAACILAHDEVLARHIYAGADLFLMPSLYEPCGLGQMIAMRFGTLPVVRKVGGLADTVDPASGFLFTDFTPDALQAAIEGALDLYRRDPEAWRTMQRTAMSKDFSWAASARRYQALYRQAGDLRKGSNSPEA
jgi:starch synthase